MAILSSFSDLFVCTQETRVSKVMAIAQQLIIVSIGHFIELFSLLPILAITGPSVSVQILDVYNIRTFFY